MFRFKFVYSLLAIAMGLHALAGTGAAEDRGAPINQLWREPADIGGLDLYAGPGGKGHEPHGPFTFEKEDLDGTSPKFDVRDQDGTKWKVKLGAEVKAETVASRLVWAVGYYVNEDYYLPEIQVKDLPDHLKRGQSLVRPGGIFEDVRLKRRNAGEKKVGNWEWKENPFTGTKEFDGLRVMMAVINNWDLKDINNAVYDRKEPSPDDPSRPLRVYMVSDLGASFGTTNLNRTHEISKGNPKSFEHSHFILKEDANTVSFQTPATPTPLAVFNPKSFVSRVDMRWIGRDIPRDHVKWINGYIQKLTPAQIKDAFRAGGFSPEEIETFSNVIQKRLAELDQL